MDIGVVAGVDVMEGAIYSVDVMEVSNTVQMS